LRETRRPAQAPLYCRRSNRAQRSDRERLLHGPVSPAMENRPQPNAGKYGDRSRPHLGSEQFPGTFAAGAGQCERRSCPKHSAQSMDGEQDNNERQHEHLPTMACQFNSLYDMSIHFSNASREQVLNIGTGRQ
jgi:hypothetical protein